MARPKLWKLNPMDFTKMTPARNEKIAAAPAQLPPEADTYLPNRIANALHPGTQHLRVAKIVDMDPFTKTFYLEADPEKGTESLAWFSAGQYISLRLKIGNMSISRPYSLSSSPRESLAGYYMLTIRRVDDGLASQYILDNWQVGTEVTASEPLGTFTYEPLRDAKTIVCLAGGGGITPFRSIAKAIADGDEDADMILLYGSNSMEEALFNDEFEDLQRTCPRFKYVNVLSGTPIEGKESGFITADLIRKYAPEGDYSVFLCGPAAMYRFVDKEVESLGLRKKFIRHEMFGEYFNPAKEADYPSDVAPAFKLTVHIAGKDYSLTAPANESLLRTMEKNGIAAPAHCRSGECGWCHSRLVSGQVYTPKSADGRREADLIYGYIHPCCAFPLSDLVIDVPPVVE